MQIKVFKAETMKDALAQVKAELGDSAVILNSRKYKEGGFFGFGGKVVVEVTAAVESIPLADRVRGTYRRPIASFDEIPVQPPSEPANITFNDDLPIARPEKSSAPSENLRNTPEPEPPPQPAENVEEPAPVDDEKSVANDLPANENISADDENLSVDEEIPVDNENLPVDEEVPVDNENLSVNEEVPVNNENLSVNEEIPADDENLSVDEEVPIEDENLPVDEDIPIEDENLPVDEDIPADENAQTQQDFGFTPEQLAQAQAMMFAQFNQYQMAMQQAMAQAQAQAHVVEMAEQMQEIHRRRSTKSEKVNVETPSEKEKIRQLEQEVTRMRSLLSGVMNRGTGINSLSLREALAFQEVDEEILKEMSSQPGIGDPSAEVHSRAARLTLSNYLEEHLKFSNGIKLNRHGPRIVAVLGTTGVGKTTTLAKIAAKFVLEQKVEAVMITADTFRISAVDQLKTYSDILSLPLEIVYTPDELNAAIEKHKNRELILIDTAGKSRSAEQMHELKEFLSVRSRIEKHLVISATTKLTDARDMIERFSVVEPERVIVTKIDETGTLGFILNLLKDSNLMLSYLTTGQGVPEDIELANVNVLTDLILKKIFGE